MKKLFNLIGEILARRLKTPALPEGYIVVPLVASDRMRITLNSELSMNRSFQDAYTMMLKVSDRPEGFEYDFDSAEIKEDVEQQ